MFKLIFKNLFFTARKYGLLFLFCQLFLFKYNSGSRISQI
jgi:hypothetical protein